MPSPVGAESGLVAQQRRSTPVYAAPVTADDIKALRAGLQCSTRELAEAVGVDQKTVIAWESAQLFPTKKFVDRMAALREKGPTAIPKKARGNAPSPARMLADPGFWQLVRKLIAHKKLRDEVTRLANDYPDPAEDER
jgi:DNA-binding transcriptional regulator YiaG